ncbi:hypothetical protein CP98_03633 [Sphingobium yanoikuyae]|uniref:Uncharacterized protein n=1 Tax=Sphingobium yanoikuyae TaxID=13690 RepID=A0A084EGP3_SPHYA|nr:hypothetical protein [Sphingobium yanoikuyae]KEZ17135.1 hypothetical protein CP98_03633 [Sphingobium yanoikuyae]
MKAEPNENGVYPKHAGEYIACPDTKNGIHCQIYVLEVDGVWLGAYSYQMGGTDQRGGGAPLAKRTRFPDHGDRQSCIKHEAERLLKSIETSDCKQAPRIREWLLSLINGPDQFDLFGAAA